MKNELVKARYLTRNGQEVVKMIIVQDEFVLEAGEEDQDNEIVKPRSEVLLSYVDVNEQKHVMINGIVLSRFMTKSLVDYLRATL